ncbi:MAG: FadR/GntR family transcriptional regulator [Thermomicrobiales bacterium]
MGHFDLTNVVDVRRTLEGEIASRAATYAASEEIALLQDILLEGERSVLNQAEFLSTDLAFHALLASAARNQLMKLLLVPIGELLFDGRHEGWTIPGRASLGISSHRRILDCVRDGDAKGAQQAMIDHINLTRFSADSHR